MLNNNQKVAVFDQIIKLIEDTTREKEKDNPKFVGTLNQAQGIKGFKTAEPGDPVFEYKDRYVIYLESLDGKTSVMIPYYKKDLEPRINFSSEFSIKDSVKEPLVNEKLYFIKFIPVEGEIKQGDWIKSRVSDAIFIWGAGLIKLEGDKKVIPVLFYRDIQVGDAYYFELKEGDWKYGVCQTEDEAKRLRNTGYYKVIGKVLTKEITEGQEFDEEEVKRLKINTSIFGLL